MFNYKNETFSTEVNEVEDIMSQMHFELVAEEIDEQIENTFTKSPKNFLELYNDRYKYFKETYGDNDDFMSQLKQLRDQTHEEIIKKIAAKFELTYEEVKPKIAKALYEFFILNYEENMVAFIKNFILKNKKWVVGEIKSMNTRRTRDTSYVASKGIMSNQQEALIITQINRIVFDILPTAFDQDDDTDFLSYIVDYDDTNVNGIIKKLFVEKQTISCDSNLLEMFMAPVLNKEDGYAEVVSTVVTELYSAYKKNMTSVSIVQ